ncbi:MAG: DUF4340 domain-containing protein [Planctomycetota bacterium]
MNAKTTVALVVIFAIGIAGYLFVVNQAPTAAPVAVGPNRLLDIKPDEVQHIAVTRGDRAYAIARDANADGWRQTEPIDFALQPFRVDDLINAAAALDIAESFTPGTQGKPALGEIGLDPPDATVTIDDATVLLGRQTLGGRAYAMLEGADQASLVPDRLHKLVASTSIRDMRQRTLDPPAAGSLQHIAITVTEPPSQRITSLRKQDADWNVGESVTTDDTRVELGTDRADRQAAADLVRQLGFLRIGGFIDDAGSLADYGLDEFKDQFMLVEARPLALAQQTEDDETKAPDTFILRIGNPADFAGTLRYATVYRGTAEPGLDAQEQHVVFTLEEADIAPLRKSIDDFRSRSLFELDPVSITSVTRTGTLAEPVTVLKDGGVFAFADVGDTPAPSFGADAQTATEWFTAIAGLTNETFAPLPPDDATPALTFEIAATVTPGIAATMRIYETSGDQDADTPALLAVVDNESAARVLTAEQVDQLTTSTLDLRNRDILDLHPADIATVSITGPGWAPLTATRIEDGWAADDGSSLNAEAIDRLVASLATLRVTGWTPATDTASWATATVALGMATPEAEPVTLAFDTASGLATLNADPSDAAAHMQLPESALARLTAEPRNRALLAFAVDQVASVTLRRGDDTLTIDQPVIGPIATSGDLADTFADADARRVLETLAGLEAQRFAPTPDPETLAPALAEWQITLRDGSTRRLAAYPSDTGATLWCTADDAPVRWFRLPIADGNALGLPEGDASPDDIK